MYVIGIDLGTTNCAVSFVDMESKNLSIQSFRIPQVTGEGYVEELLTLPSFCYISAPNEFPGGSMKLPWDTSSKNIIAGTFAKKYGEKVPTRLVQSAKSWLCHSGAHRRDPILPFNELNSEKISPVFATSIYLDMIRKAWNYKKAKGVPELEFEQQDIVLTVPASFDEVARLLTLEAAKLAGYEHVTFLEEPQSAFYAWISDHEASLDADFKDRDLILVIDVGGGTTDFSLIEVRKESEKNSFQRMAVGDHLLLGGDNMDALIAHELEKRCPELSTLQRLQLKQEARNAKEELLSGQGEEYKVLLQGKGSSVISGSISTQLKRQEVENWLMSGFFAGCSYDETKRLKKTAGIKSLGLPFEDEPSIIKQLGAFLHQAGDQQPNFVLFNGGTMKPQIFQEAILKTLNNWFTDKNIKACASPNLDLAVSRGAAYYGKVRKGLGVKVLGGAARGYYLELEVKRNGKADNLVLCCLPRGSDDGASYESMQSFFVTPNTPVSFQLYTSHVRLHDAQGDLINISEEEFQALPPIHTVLRFGKAQIGQKEKIPVHLKVSLTAIGTLEINLVSQVSDHVWALEFQLKTASNSLNLLQTSRNDETFDENYLTPAKELLISAFSTNDVSLKNLMEKLEEVIGKSRKDFPPSVLRTLFDTLLSQEEYRLKSQEHEERFFNLAGFFLRPGFGYPLDDFRIKNFWKIILSDLKRVKSLQSRLQRLICYRRIAAGFTKGQQLQLKAELLPELVSGKISVKGRTELYEYSEKVRAFALYEYVDVPLKVKYGQAILERIQKGIAVDADYFALGHLGARHLIYGKISDIVPVKVVQDWIEKLLKVKEIDEEKLGIMLSQLGRKTDLAEFNITAELVDKILKRFEGSSMFEMLTKRMRTLEKLTNSEQAELFGETLPLGLSLES